MVSRWNKLRFLTVGPILIVLGIVLYFVKGIVPVLVLPVIGAVLLVIGLIVKVPSTTEPNPNIEEK